MKNLLAIFIALLSSTWVLPQAPARANTSEDNLDSVLTQMDKSSAGFKSAQADFQWDQYEKVVDQTDVQTGTIYLRRNNNNVDAAIHIVKPSIKQVVLKDGKIRMYEPKIDQLTERETGKNRADVESFMNLGFGGRGHELLKTYEVKLAGWETIDSVKTAKLELVPMNEKWRSMFSRIIIWVDLERDISLRQQMFEPSGDYRLAHFTNFKLNARLPDEAFRIKTTSRTKKVNPR